jgi:hypothetical protein
MQDARSLKNPRELKRRIERLISFEEGNGLTWKVEEQSLGDSRPPSKYRKVLTCSHTNGTSSAASSERIPAQRG